MRGVIIRWRTVRPPQIIVWLGGWISLAHRVRDLELRVVELEREARR